jgi:hypothetical protein
MKKSKAGLILPPDLVKPPLGGSANDAPAQARPTPPVRRLGKFFIAQALLDVPITARAVFRDMIVFRAEANFVNNTLVVFADHPDFDLAIPGQEVPLYQATITSPSGRAPRRPADLFVAWRRVVDPAAEEATPPETEQPKGQKLPGPKDKGH